MISDERKHNVWLACMKLSNCTPNDAVNFIKSAEDILFEPITPTGQDILMVASSVGSYFVVRQCLLHGAQANKQDSVGRTALHYAASIGNINIFQELVKEGGNPLQQTIGGETPLTKACIFCQGDIIEWYLNNASNAFEIADNYGKKPLDMLKLEGQDLYA